MKRLWKHSQLKWKRKYTTNVQESTKAHGHETRHDNKIIANAFKRKNTQIEISLEASKTKKQEKMKNVERKKLN